MWPYLNVLPTSAKSECLKHRFFIKDPSVLPSCTLCKGFKMQISTPGYSQARRQSVFRQQTATANQQIRKPMTQTLLKMKATRQGPSVGNFLKIHVSDSEFGQLPNKLQEKLNSFPKSVACLAA